MDNPFVIKDVLLFTGEAFIEDGEVEVRNGVIAYAGKRRESTLPALSRPGHTLIPGLIDAHIHGLEGNVDALAQSLRFGVTTVCDQHNDSRSLKKLAGLAADPNKKSLYADFKCAGQAATIADGWPAPVLKLEFQDDPTTLSHALSSLPNLHSPSSSPSSATNFVQSQITHHSASYIKLMHETGDLLSLPTHPIPTPSPSLQASLVTAAHAHNLPAVGHAFSHAGALALLAAGVDGLTHIFLDAPPPPPPPPSSPGSDYDWLALLKRNGAHVNPTLGCVASQVGEGAGLHEGFMREELVVRMLGERDRRLEGSVVGELGFARAAKERAEREDAGEGKGRVGFRQAVENTRRCYEEGVPLVVGSDCAGKGLGTLFGLGVHVEMWLMRWEVGMKTEEVLGAATAVTAQRFGFADRGRLENGRKADLVLLSGDVRVVMEDRERRCLPVVGVWRDGVLTEAYEGDQNGET